jgi:hypothetical protein
MDAYAAALANAAGGNGPVVAQEGGSGYFSTPDSGLDPRLFHGTVMRPQVRQWLQETLYQHWNVNDARSWSKTWLAGSGISYQWAADRSNGDLDVLIGIDWSRFFQANPRFLGMSAEDVADHLNADLKKNLWVNTAFTPIGTDGVPGDPHAPGAGIFEVTFYVNPHSYDIRDIKPYAAYCLTDDTWTVKPPVLPQNPETLYPQAYFDHVQRERTHAQGLLDRYNSLLAQTSSSQQGTPGWLNAVHGLDLVIDQAKAMFDDIHLGRREAFGPNGQGYGDFANFRWQSHKRYGTVQALAALTQVRRQAGESVEQALYGTKIADAGSALRTAALWNQR